MMSFSDVSDVDLSAMRCSPGRRESRHSCGRFTLEDLFGGSDPSVLRLAKQFIRMLRSLGDVQIVPQKTRLVCVTRMRFAGLTPRKDHFVANFALQRWVKRKRVIKTEE